MTTVATRQVKVKSRLQRRLARHGVTYNDIAAEARVSWFMVWAVLNRRRTSRRVLEAAERLLLKATAA